MTFQQQTYSILVLGASGRTGTQISKHLATHPQKPNLHAFCRSPSKLQQQQDIFHSIIKGDAKNTSDLHRAIQTTNAKIVVVAIGDGDNLSKTNTRTESARALVEVLLNPEFHDVNVLVVSSNGTAPSTIRIGMGMGKLITYHLRHILRDHKGQEDAFKPIAHRTFTIRPTALTDGKHNPTILEFGDNQKAPTIHIDRSDVGRYAADKIFTSGTFDGRVVNITAARKSRQ